MVDTELLQSLPSGVASQRRPAPHPYQWKAPDPRRQFHNEQHDERHGGTLIWPGHPHHGIPVWVEPAMSPIQTSTMSVEELDSILIYITHQYTKVFDLTDSNDLDYYNWVYRRIRALWFVENRREVLDSDGCRVLLEWTQAYFQLPGEDRRPHSTSSVGSLDHGRLSSDKTTRILG